MLWIISGPTSVGKSTFIFSPRAFEITGLSSESELVWPDTQDDRLEEGGASDFLYHYNTLRPHFLSRMREARDGSQDHRPAADDGLPEFGGDPKWRELCEFEVEKKAVVLVASKRAILQRLEQRNEQETSEFASEAMHSAYSVRFWREIVERVDLVGVCQAWCRELESKSIPYILVDSGKDEYPLIESEEDLPDIVNDPGYTKEQIEEILRQRDFAYHKVELPFGLHTPGDDRSETRDLILPDSLSGRSVLDVGSALGYFCFEAEAKGAERIVGVELKDDRFRDAELLKEIKGSRVEFLQRDIVLDPLDETFDYVLLLNVIHHLKEPFRAIRQLASIARERLVIEFPTFEDQKFQNVAEVGSPSLYNHLPLIGVSSTRAGQTFVYTPEAIKRVLLDHERLFAKVEVIASPMPGRAIAICHKYGSSSEAKGSGKRRTVETPAAWLGREDSQRLREAERRVANLTRIRNRLKAQKEWLERRNRGLEATLEAQRRRAFVYRLRSFLKRRAPSVEERVDEILRKIRRGSGRN